MVAGALVFTLVCLLARLPLGTVQGQPLIYTLPVLDTPVDGACVEIVGDIDVGTGTKLFERGKSETAVVVAISNANWRFVRGLGT